MNYPSLQNGYTISGTVTTDGNTGTISDGDVTSWSIAISLSGVNQYTFTPDNSYLNANLMATTSELSAPATASDDYLAISNDYNQALLSWNTAVQHYLFYTGSYYLWVAGWPPQSNSGGVLAAVPEPSSAVLAVIGAATLLACGLARQSWAKRRQTAVGHTQSTE